MNQEILQSLAKEGSFFIYDLDGLLLWAKKIKNSNAKIFFACKANPLGEILKTLHQVEISFDIASIGELKQVLQQGVIGCNIIMTGPAKSEELLRLGLQNKVATFVIESPSQLYNLEKLAKEYDYKPNVLIRLQLLWENEGKNILGGNTITPFGMDIKTAKELLKNISLPFLGFHVFQWGNILSIEKLRDIWEYTIETCKSLCSNFKVLDVGGGLGIPYAKEEQAIAWSDVDNLVATLKSKHNIEEFWIEMGRYMCGEFGQYITTVVDRKETYGRKILVLEGGVNHLVRPALINQPFQAKMLRESKEQLDIFALHGSLCTSLDFMGEHQFPQDVKEGDMIAFQQSGAYGFTESMPFFLCHKLAGEVVIKNSKIEIVRKAESASFWLK